MKKFFMVMAVTLISALGFCESYSYGKLNYNDNNGYFFKNITDERTDTLFLGRTPKEAIKTVDYFISLCQGPENDNIWNRYVDVNDNKYIIVRQFIMVNKNDEIGLLYSREYGVPGQCSWYIMEIELHEITNFLSIIK